MNNLTHVPSQTSHHIKYFFLVHTLCIERALAFEQHTHLYLGDVPNTCLWVQYRANGCASQLHDSCVDLIRRWCHRAKWITTSLSRNVLTEFQKKFNDLWSFGLFFEGVLSNPQSREGGREEWMRGSGFHHVFVTEVLCSRSKTIVCSLLSYLPQSKLHGIC